VRRPTKRSIGLGAIIGYAAFSVGLFLPSMIARAARWVDPPMAVTVSTSRQSAPNHDASLAFDGNPRTAWAAAGGAPVTLTVSPATPGILRRIELEARAGGSLYEGWQNVRVELFANGELAASQTYAIPEAADQPVVAIVLPAVRTDRVEFHFSSPVTKLRDGSHVDADAVNPGYREIRLHWEPKP
jgi:hypothetical protein